MTLPRKRILILRSCRLAQFLTAVVVARRRNPEAEVVALSHRGHHHELRAAGVDRVIEIPGRRFGLTSVPPWQLGDLRAGGFDQVIIPQMNERPDEHVNVYRFVLSLNPASVAIIAGEALPREFDRGEFLAYVLQHSTAGIRQWDAAMFAVLAAGLVERFVTDRLR